LKEKKKKKKRKKKVLNHQKKARDGMIVKKTGAVKKAQ
jgi:hypothetical protein